MCLGPWKDHTGSYYSCNMYNPDDEKKGEAEVRLTLTLTLTLTETLTLAL